MRILSVAVIVLIAGGAITITGCIQRVAEDGAIQDQGQPRLSLTVIPPVTFAPAKIYLVAELKGGDDEEFYCAAAEWDWGDGSTSEWSSDCPPYERGKSRVRRRFTAIHEYSHDTAATYRIQVRLKRNNVILVTVTGAAHVRSDLRVYGFRVLRAYPHDPQAFTQGLIYRDGFLFESTGLNGRSTLRKVRLETGEVIQRRDLDSLYFGEGATDWGDRLVQLTFRSNLGFVYDISTLDLERPFTYSGEGWGLTRDRNGLIMSDGSSTLRFLDPATFRETRTILVSDHDVPVHSMNELELVRGEIFANIYPTDLIARISPVSGQVTGWIDLRGLLPDTVSAAELNGIAYDPAGNRLFVTGKLWPRLFEIQLVVRD